MAAFAVLFFCCLAVAVIWAWKLWNSPQVHHGKRKIAFFLKVAGEALNNPCVSKLKQNNGFSHPFAIAGTMQDWLSWLLFTLFPAGKFYHSKIPALRESVPFSDTTFWHVGKTQRLCFCWDMPKGSIHTALGSNARKLDELDLYTSKRLCNGFVHVDSSLSILCIRVGNGKAIKLL